MNFNPFPTPPQLFRQFEKGEISREELHATMALHARQLIGEMEEARANPRQSYLERLRNLASMRGLVKRHGAPLVREILVALGEMPGFPPAQILWNAGHSDVPLHCFIRSRVEPVFRITRLVVAPMLVTIDVEYGRHARHLAIRESIVLERDARLVLSLQSRNLL